MGLAQALAQVGEECTRNCRRIQRSLLQRSHAVLRRPHPMSDGIGQFTPVSSGDGLKAYISLQCLRFGHVVPRSHHNSSNHPDQIAG